MKRYTLGIPALIIVVSFVVGAVLLHRTSHTQPSAQPSKLYVAMGDSVAAGVGLKNDSDSSACDRTNQSYPNLVASTLHYKLQNIACSGATLPSGILGTQAVNDLQVVPQAQQLFSGSKPSLVSITIGANDAHWTDILAKCYTTTCGTADDTAAVTASLQTVSTNLQTFLAQVKAKYPVNPPQVIVTGYHQVFPTTPIANCTDLTGIDTGELAWGRQLQTNISNSLEQATAGFSFAHFVPITFTGHELCTANPWVQGLLDKEPYHPTAAGQAEFAADIVKALHN